MPDIEYEIAQLLRKIALTETRLDRIAGDEIDRSARVVLLGELERHKATLAGLRREQIRLVVLAPHDGIVRDLDPYLAIGEWISDTTPMFRVVRQLGTIARGYVSEDDVWRLREGAHATFISEDSLTARRTGRLVEIAQFGAHSLELPYLSSVLGGAVPSDRYGENEILPRQGRHPVRIALGGAPMDRVVRGTLHLDAKAESFAAAMWRRLLQILVREMSA